MAKKETPKSSEFTREEWVERFEDYFAAKHCSLFGRHMPVAMPDERHEAAKWYADLIMAVSSGDYGD